MTTEQRIEVAAMIERYMDRHILECHTDNGAITEAEHLQEDLSYMHKIEDLERQLGEAGAAYSELKMTLKKALCEADQNYNKAKYLENEIDALTAKNEQLLTDNEYLHHNYHHITQRVKDLLAAVDKINPDVDGYFEPCNGELCELRDWVKDMML